MTQDSLYNRIYNSFLEGNLAQSLSRDNMDSFLRVAKEICDTHQVKFECHIANGSVTARANKGFPLGEIPFSSTSNSANWRKNSSIWRETCQLDLGC